MVQNILTYVFTDIFYQLWMAAAYSKKKGQSILYTKNHWPTEFVQQLEEDEIPSLIEVIGEFHHLNNDGEFHLGRNSPSLGFDEMKIVWGDEVMMAVPRFDGKMWTVKNVHREVGPAEVILTGVKKWHHNGEPHRKRGDAIICKQARFIWAKNGDHARENGPYEIVLKNVTAKSTNGQVSEVHYLSKSFFWSTHSKTKIPSRTANEIIERCKLKVDFLAVDSIFAGDDDEFIFLSELGD